MASNEKSTLSVKERIKGAQRQRRSTRINLRGDLVAEIERLDTELREVQDAERNAQASKRLGGHSEATVIADRIESLRAEMSEHWLELVLEAKPFNEWRAFKAANPAREDNDYDGLVGVNFDVLVFEFMPRCVIEPELDKEDWEGLFDKVAPADLRDVGAVAFSLHEQGLDVPKSLRASAIKRGSADDSEQPRLSE